MVSVFFFFKNDVAEWTASFIGGRVRAVTLPGIVASDSHSAIAFCLKVLAVAGCRLAPEGTDLAE